MEIIAIIFFFKKASNLYNSHHKGVRATPALSDPDCDLDSLLISSELGCGCETDFQGSCAGDVTEQRQQATRKERLHCELRPGGPQAT